MSQSVSPSMEYVSVTEHEAVSSSCSLYVTGVRGKCACARVTGSRQGKLTSGGRFACMSQDEGRKKVTRWLFCKDEEKGNMFRHLHWQ